MALGGLLDFSLIYSTSNDASLNRHLLFKSKLKISYTINMGFITKVGVLAPGYRQSNDDSLLWTPIISLPRLPPPTSPHPTHTYTAPPNSVEPHLLSPVFSIHRWQNHHLLSFDYPLWTLVILWYIQTLWRIKYHSLKIPRFNNAMLHKALILAKWPLALYRYLTSMPPLALE